MDGVIVATPKKWKKTHGSIAFITLNIKIRTPQWWIFLGAKFGHLGKNSNLIHTQQCYFSKWAKLNKKKFKNLLAIWTRLHVACYLQTILTRYKCLFHSCNFNTSVHLYNNILFDFSQKSGNHKPYLIKSLPFRFKT
jgi:hypothetical protein